MSHFDLSSKNKQIEEYDKQTLEPDFWQDQKKAQQVIRAKNALKDIVDRYEELDLQLTSLNDTADELKSEFDEELMMTYLDGGEVSVELLKKAIREATLKAEFFPFMCGTALGNMGIKPLLDAVIDYLPSPLDVASIECTDDKGNEILRHPSDSEPFTALAFKVMTDPFVGKLTFFRVYSGTLKSGSYVMNSTKGEKERGGTIYASTGNQLSMPRLYRTAALCRLLRQA